MKNLKKDFEELTDKEKKTILKSTIVCGVSVLVVAVLTKKHITNVKTIKEYAENNKRFKDLLIRHDTALDELYSDVSLLKRVVVKSE